MDSKLGRSLIAFELAAVAARNARRRANPLEAAAYDSEMLRGADVFHGRNAHANWFWFGEEARVFAANLGGIALLGAQLSPLARRAESSALLRRHGRSAVPLTAVVAILATVARLRSVEVTPAARLPTTPERRGPKRSRDEDVAGADVCGRRESERSGERQRREREHMFVEKSNL